MEEEKICRKCQKKKPLSEFHLDSSSKDGHKNICKKCLSKRKFNKIQKPGFDRNIKQSLDYCLKNNGPFRWSVLLKYNGNDIRSHFEKLFEKGMTFENYGKEWCASFFIPRRCYSISSIKDEDFVKFWSLKNLKPVWKKDCQKQNTKISRKILNEYSLWDILPIGNFAEFIVD